MHCPLLSSWCMNAALVSYSPVLHWSIVPNLRGRYTPKVLLFISSLHPRYIFTCIADMRLVIECLVVCVVGWGDIDIYMCLAASIWCGYQIYIDSCIGLAASIHSGYQIYIDNCIGLAASIHSGYQIYIDNCIGLAASIHSGYQIYIDNCIGLAASIHSGYLKAEEDGELLMAWLLLLYICLFSAHFRRITRISITGCRSNNINFIFIQTLIYTVCFNIGAPTKTSHMSKSQTIINSIIDWISSEYLTPHGNVHWWRSLCILIQQYSMSLTASSEKGHFFLQHLMWIVAPPGG